MVNDGAAPHRNMVETRKTRKQSESGMEPSLEVERTGRGAATGGHAGRAVTGGHAGRRAKMGTGRPATLGRREAPIRVAGMTKIRVTDLLPTLTKSQNFLKGALRARHFAPGASRQYLVT